MKLSDAIILGDTLKTGINYTWLEEQPDGTICGCALGGALLADGCTPEKDPEVFWI